MKRVNSSPGLCQSNLLVLSELLERAMQSLTPTQSFSGSQKGIVPVAADLNNFSSEQNSGHMLDFSV